MIMICDEVVDADSKLIPKEDDETNFNEKKVTCKKQNIYILLAFLSITVALSIAVSIYCYLIKYNAKQNRDTKLKQAYINNKN